MKKFLFSVLLTVATTVSAYEIKGNTITLTPSETKQCESQGGCMVVPIELIPELLSEYVNSKPECISGGGCMLVPMSELKKLLDEIKRLRNNQFTPNKNKERQISL